MLRDYINATIGFEELRRRTKRPAKSLMRMLGPSGNPQARSLLEVIQHLQAAEELHFELSLRAAIGALSDGAEASFLALEGNPLEDLQNVHRIRLRFKQGFVLGGPQN